MKSIIIFFRQCKSIWKRNVLLYSMLVFVLSITFLALIYQYSITIDNIEDMRKQNQDNYSIQINVNKIKAEEIEKLYKEKKFHISNIYIYKVLSSKLGLPKSYMGNNMLTASVNINDKKDHFQASISKENIEKSDKVIITPSYYMANQKEKKKSIWIEKKEFQIIGDRQDYENMYEIPYTTFAQLFSPDYVKVVVEQSAGEIVYDNIKSYVHKNWEVDLEDIELPSLDQDTNTRKTTAVYMLAITAFIAFLNCSYIYMYILQKRRKEFAIMCIVGCKKSKAFIYYIFEVLLLSVISFGVGLALYWSINQFIFATVFSIAKSSIRCRNLIELATTAIIVMSAIISVITYRFTKATPRVQFLEGEEY